MKAVQVLISEKLNFLQNGFDSFHQIAIEHFEELHLNAMENYFIHFINFTIVSLALIDSYYIE